MFAVGLTLQTSCVAFSYGGLPLLALAFCVCMVPVRLWLGERGHGNVLVGEVLRLLHFPLLSLLFPGLFPRELLVRAFPSTRTARSYKTKLISLGQSLNKTMVNKVVHTNLRQIRAPR